MSVSKVRHIQDALTAPASPLGVRKQPLRSCDFHGLPTSCLTFTPGNGLCYSRHHPYSFVCLRSQHLHENVSTITKHITTNSNQRPKKYQIIDIDSIQDLKKATSSLHSHQQLVCFQNVKEELFEIMISGLPLLRTTHSSLYYFSQSSNPHWPLTHCLHFLRICVPEIYFEENFMYLTLLA